MFRDAIGFAAFLLAACVVLAVGADILRATSWLTVGGIVIALSGFFTLLAPGLGRQLANDATGAERGLSVFMMMIGGVIYGFGTLSIGLDREGGVLAAAHPTLHGLQREIGFAPTDDLDGFVADPAFGAGATSDFTAAPAAIETASIAQGALVEMSRADVVGRDRVRLALRNPTQYAFEGVEIVVNEGDGVRARRLARIAGETARPFSTLAPEVQVRDVGAPLGVCVSGRRADGVWVRGYTVFAPMTAHLNGALRPLRRDPMQEGPSRLACG